MCKFVNSKREESVEQKIKGEKKEKFEHLTLIMSIVHNKKKNIKKYAFICQSDYINHTREETKE